MPFKSKAQQRFMFAAEDRGDVPKGTAEEWARASEKKPGGIKALPEKVKQKKTAGEIAESVVKVAFDELKLDELKLDEFKLDELKLDELKLDEFKPDKLKLDTFEPKRVKSKTLNPKTLNPKTMADNVRNSASRIVENAPKSKFLRNLGIGGAALGAAGLGAYGLHQALKQKKTAGEMAVGVLIKTSEPKIASADTDWAKDLQKKLLRAEKIRFVRNTRAALGVGLLGAGALGAYGLHRSANTPKNIAAGKSWQDSINSDLPGFDYDIETTEDIPEKTVFDYKKASIKTSEPKIASADTDWVKDLQKKLLSDPYKTMSLEEMAELGVRAKKIRFARNIRNLGIGGAALGAAGLGGYGLYRALHHDQKEAADGSFDYSKLKDNVSRLRDAQDVLEVEAGMRSPGVSSRVAEKIRNMPDGAFTLGGGGGKSKLLRNLGIGGAALGAAGLGAYGLHQALKQKKTAGEIARDIIEDSPETIQRQRINSALLAGTMAPLFSAGVLSPALLEAGIKSPLAHIGLAGGMALGGSLLGYRMGSLKSPKPEEDLRDSRRTMTALGVGGGLGALGGGLLGHLAPAKVRGLTRILGALGGSQLGARGAAKLFPPKEASALADSILAKKK